MSGNNALLDGMGSLHCVEKLVRLEVELEPKDLSWAFAPKARVSQHTNHAHMTDTVDCLDCYLKLVRRSRDEDRLTFSSVL